MAQAWTKRRIGDVADALGVRQAWIELREEMRKEGGLGGKDLWVQSWERFLAERPELREQAERTGDLVKQSYSPSERETWDEKKGGKRDAGKRVGTKRTKSAPEIASTKAEAAKKGECADPPAGDSPSGRAGGSDGTQIPGVMQQYVDAAEFGGLSANGLDEVRWVASNIAVSNPQASTCPSPAAWGLLYWVRRSAANAEKFWTNIWPKTLPSKSSMGGGGEAGGAEGGGGDDTDLDDLLMELSGELEKADVESGSV